MLDLSVTTLNRYRRDKPDAGGLIIASSISHAKEIYNLLEKATGESPLLVTSEDKNSQDTIANYKSGTQKWLISVGMVTEGTDIPRLQVCCHLSRICTELHFRQVLGRAVAFMDKVFKSCIGFSKNYSNWTTFHRVLSKTHLPSKSVFLLRKSTALCRLSDTRFEFLAPENLSSNFICGLESGRIIHRWAAAVSIYSWTSCSDVYWVVDAYIDKMLLYYSKEVAIWDGNHIILEAQYILGCSGTPSWAI